MIINEKILQNADQSVELVRNFKECNITHAFHDIDGTYSLIRKWEPVMSAVLNDVIVNGLPENFNSPVKLSQLIEAAENSNAPESDRFCIESAGLSALTQMEWSIRRALQSGTIQVQCFSENSDLRKINDIIIDEIWSGVEDFEHSLNEPEELKAFIGENSSKLFRLYEQVLRKFCRDKNLQLAKDNPAEWLVPGSMDFLEMLHSNGVKNYFITGAVVGKNGQEYSGTMYEELQALDFEIGENQIIDELYGSDWGLKKSKEQIMKEICDKENISGENILIIGDGRSEISAGVSLGALCISRLSEKAERQRSIHHGLGTNIILSDYLSICDILTSNLN